MIPMKMFLKVVVFAAVSLISTKVYSQQTRVDSVIALLNKSKTAKGLDTVMFNSARNLISTAVLTDAHITQIEKAAEIFKTGTDEELCYVLKTNILRSLSASDEIKAIDYGKINLEKLETSKTPHAEILRTRFLVELRIPYRNSSKLSEGFTFFAEKLNSYKKNNDSSGLNTCYYVLSGFYRNIGLYEQAIYSIKKSISYIDSTIIGELYFGIEPRNTKAIWINNSGLLCDFYLQMGDYEKAIKAGEISMQVALRYYNEIGKTRPGDYSLFTARHMANAKISSNQLDSVDYYLKMAELYSVNIPLKAYLLQRRSLYNIKKGELGVADSLLRLSWQLVNQNQLSASTSGGIIEPDYYIALLRIQQKRHQEAIALLLKDIDRVRTVRTSVLRDYKLLAELYEKTGDNARAKETYKSFISLQDSILADQSKFRTISFETEQLISDNEISIAQLEGQNKIASLTRNFIIGLAALLLLLVAGIYYRFHAKKKANQVLEQTLTELKSTQSQLIQSEKMASLGELTAGIAHEIQNPLNFVNNFSEVSGELIKEMVDEVEKGNTEEVKAIANDVVQNLEKINHHGKRAADIVKGMLQHSRTSSGQKEPTDINALCDEYLRLAYHGLRAKDKSFNATLKTNFDESIGNITIIPQDIGRVILNLITNAFYVVNEKSKAPQPPEGGVAYEPTVTITTSSIQPPSGGPSVQIKVSDNGGGIPQKILDKIFQPFFTTKPTGQGTGLGLSLSYDIVKAHGGELMVETKEGEGSAFIIMLPVL
jgi:two-component system, NtrC family, sensor kinase